MRCNSEDCNTPLWLMEEMETKICTACLSRKKRLHAQKHNQRIIDHKGEQDLPKDAS